MKKIQLTQNMVAVVDDEDYALLNKYKWCARNGRCTFYARRNIRLSNGQWTTLSMHRQVLGLEHGDRRQVDHINHHGLDNRKSNLRICTRLENQHNQIPRTGTSNFKGVHKQNNRWKAQIGIGGKTKHLGYFSKPEQAALAYDLAAITSFRQFANTNLF